MSEKLDGDLKIGLADAAAALARVPDPFVVLFERGDLSIELYARAVSISRRRTAATRSM